MNYRHAFHAGNHADVFKHLTLTRLIALMSRKEQPFAYLDTHAGIGLYDLQGDQANRTGEYLEGIARLWGQTDLPPLAADYMRVLHEDNRKGDRRVKVHLGEGWHVPGALLPVPEKRALMLIDPPFEKLDEMQ